MQESGYSVEHIGLAARDPAKLKDWYVRVLEGRTVFASRGPAPAFLVRLPGGVMLELYLSQLSVDETANNRLSGWRHLALRVDSVEDARRELSERGVEFSEPIKPAGGGGLVLFFADPEGNLLHLVERHAAIAAA